MSTNPRMQLQRTKNVDPSVLKNPSGPPIYKVVTSHKSAMDSRVDDSTDYKHAPWLLRRTSIHVESAPADLADESSDVMSISTTRSDEKPSKRPFLNRFVDKRVEEDHHDDASSIAPSTQSTVYGTTVSIEAGKPKVIYSKHSWLRELKSLEQAASIKLWAGTGKPAEVWGKLLKVTNFCVTFIPNADTDSNRTLTYGIPPATHWFTLATSVLKLPFGSIPPCWKRRTRMYSSESCKTAGSGLLRPHLNGAMVAYRISAISPLGRRSDKPLRCPRIRLQGLGLRFDMRSIFHHLTTTSR